MQKKWGAAKKVPDSQTLPALQCYEDLWLGHAWLAPLVVGLEAVAL